MICVKDLVFIGLCLSLDEIQCLAEKQHKALLRFCSIFLFRSLCNGKAQLSTKEWFYVTLTEVLRRVLKSEGWVSSLGSKGCRYWGAPVPSSPVPLQLFHSTLQALDILFIQSTPGFKETLWNFLSSREPVSSPQLVAHLFHPYTVIRVCCACVGYRDITFWFTFWKLCVISRCLTFLIYIGVL